MELAENFHPHADGRDKASFNPPSFPYHPHSTFRIKPQGGANLIPYLYFVTSQITEFLPSFLGENPNRACCMQYRPVVHLIAVRRREFALSPCFTVISRKCIANASPFRTVLSYIKSRWRSQMPKYFLYMIAYSKSAPLIGPRSSGL